MFEFLLRFMGLLNGIAGSRVFFPLSYETYDTALTPVYYLGLTLHRKPGGRQWISIEIMKEHPDGVELDVPSPDWYEANFFEGSVPFSTEMCSLIERDIGENPHLFHDAEIAASVASFKGSLTEVMKTELPIPKSVEEAARVLGDFMYEFRVKLGVDVITTEPTFVDGDKRRIEAIRVMKKAWGAHGGTPPPRTPDDPDASLAALTRALCLRRFCRVRGLDSEDMETEVVEPFARDIVRFL